MSLDLFTAVETILAATVYLVGFGFLAIVARAILDALFERKGSDEDSC